MFRTITDYEDYVPDDLVFEFKDRFQHRYIGCLYMIVEKYTSIKSMSKEMSMRLIKSLNRNMGSTMYLNAKIIAIIYLTGIL